MSKWKYIFAYLLKLEAEKTKDVSVMMLVTK